MKVFQTFNVSERSQDNTMGVGAGVGSGSGKSTQTRAIIVIVAVVVIIAIIILCVMLGVSFRGLHYYEYGFVRTVSTGAVDTSEVYEGGLHGIGPNKEFKIFRADAHFVDLEELSVGTKSGNEVVMDVTFQYFLSKDDLKALHDEYDLEYDEIILASASEAIKQTTIQFENKELLRDRDRVEKALIDAVKARIQTQCCASHCQDNQEDHFCPQGCIKYSDCKEDQKGLYVYMHDLQIGAIDLPSDLRERYLNALLLETKTQTKELEKNVTVIEKETEILVNRITNQAHEVRQNATAEANLIRSRASSDAKLITEQAKINGLKMILGALNITDPDNINSVNYLRKLQDMNKLYIGVDYQYLIRSP